MIKLDPYASGAFLNRAAAYDTLGDHERAIKDYNQAIKLDPKSAMAYDDRGTTYDEVKDYDRAIKDYDQAIKLDPQYVLAYTNRGNTYESKGDAQRAIADYEQALRLNPGNATATKELTKLKPAPKGQEAGGQSVAGTASAVPWAARDGIGMPRCVSCPPPQYASRDREEGIEGMVVLEVVIQTDGRSGEVKVIKGLDPAMDAKAVEAVRKWTFTPATGSNGVPVATRTQIEITFRLR